MQINVVPYTVLKGPKGKKRKKHNNIAQINITKIAEEKNTLWSSFARTGVQVGLRPAQVDRPYKEPSHNCLPRTRSVEE